MTGFFGGNNYPRGIVTFDWATMEYTIHPSEFSGNRASSVCGILKGANGETLIAVAGGISSGLEVWNPDDDSVKMLTPEFPKGYDFGSPQLISVNGGDELIFYEAAHTDNTKGIWKYLSSNNSWYKIGEMLFPRNDFVVLPVEDLSCPSDKK